MMIRLLPRLMTSAVAFLALSSGSLQAATSTEIARCIVVSRLTAADPKTPPAAAKHYATQAVTLEKSWREQETKKGKAKQDLDRALQMQTKLMLDQIKNPISPNYDPLKANMELCISDGLIKGL